MHAPHHYAKEYLILSPTEARITQCLATKDNGASVSQLAREIGLARTSIYNALSTLKKKSLLAQDGFIYTLADPHMRYDSKKPTSAKEQIENLLDELLMLKKGEVVYSIESDEEIAHLLQKEAGLPAWQQAIADKGIVLKGVGSSRALSLFQTMTDTDLRTHIKRRSGSARFVADALPGVCILVSFRDSVIFFSRTKKLFHRIDNTEVARFTQGIIDALYIKLRYHPLVKE